MSIWHCVRYSTLVTAVRNLTQLCACWSFEADMLLKMCHIKILWPGQPNCLTEQCLTEKKFSLTKSHFWPPTNNGQNTWTKPFVGARNFEIFRRSFNYSGAIHNFVCDSYTSADITTTEIYHVWKPTNYNTLELKCQVTYITKQNTRNRFWIIQCDMLGF